jgi:plasmid maintenance system antidote protein VapI
MGNSVGHRDVDKGLGIIAQLRQAIRESSTSRSALARAVGISQSVLQQFVHGQRSIDFQTAERLCDYLGLSLYRATRKAAPHEAIALRERGLKPAAIAAMLGVSRRTVFRYCKTLPAKHGKQSTRPTPPKSAVWQKLDHGRLRKATKRRGNVGLKSSRAVSQKEQKQRRAIEESTVWVRS